jgi:hypothetical protein
MALLAVPAVLAVPAFLGSHSLVRIVQLNEQASCCASGRVIGVSAFGQTLIGVSFAA